MPTTQRYFITIDDLADARGELGELSFQGSSPEAFATTLQSALRDPTFWERWKAMQPDPEAVDPALGVNDPAATVTGTQSDLHCEIQVVTNLPHSVLKHRLTLLVGRHWKLHDVSAA